MPKDFYSVYKTALTLNEKLRGAKVNKITQPENYELDFLLYNGKSFTLTVNVSPELLRAGLTDIEKPSPAVAPSFCMLLRKYLQGGEITGVRTLNDDRIIDISFTNKNDFFETENLDLIVELMGKFSNAFLVKDGCIAGALKNAPRELSAKRLIASGLKYTFIEKDYKPLLWDAEALKKTFRDNEGLTADFLIKNFGGLSPVTAEEAVYRIKKLSYNYDLFAKEFLSLLHSPEGVIITDEKGFKDVYPFDYLSLNGKRREYSDFLSAQKAYFDGKQIKKTVDGKRREILSAITPHVKHEQKKLSNILLKIESAKDADKYRLYGELITASAYAVKRGDKRAELTNYYSDNQEKIAIPLDENLSPQKNAQKYFARYAKLKNTLKAAIPQKEETEARLKYLSELKSEAEELLTDDDYRDIKEELVLSGILKAEKSKRTEKKRVSEYLSFEYLGFKIFAGKNNVQNDRLTFSSHGGDIWLHVKNYRSSHVIIKTDGKEPPEAVLLTAAEIAAYYSEVKLSGTKTAVDYAYKKFVKKPPKANPGAVIYTDFKTLTVIPNAHDELKITK